MTAFLAGLVIGAAAAAAVCRRLYRRKFIELGRLFAFAAHEINTPITAVNMTVLNFLGGIFGEVPEDQLKWMEMMRTQIARLAGIAGELRDFIHLELIRDLSLRLEPASVSEAVEVVLQSLQKGIPESELNLELAVAPGLPMVSADPERLPRTIGSLLFHARKFKASGKVCLRADRRGDAVAIELEYLGQKLSVEEAERSLDLYFPATRRRDQMLSCVGMGLGTLRSLVLLQGGDLKLSVDEGGKALLTMLLRVAK